MTRWAGGAKAYVWIRDGKRDVGAYDDPKAHWHLLPADRFPEAAREVATMLCGVRENRLHWMPDGPGGWEYLSMKQPSKICYECVEALMT